MPISRRVPPLEDYEDVRDDTLAAQAAAEAAQIAAAVSESNTQTLRDQTAAYASAAVPGETIYADAATGLAANPAENAIWTAYSTGIYAITIYKTVAGVATVLAGFASASALTDLVDTVGLSSFAPDGTGFKNALGVEYAAFRESGAMVSRYVSALDDGIEVAGVRNDLGQCGVAMDSAGAHLGTGFKVGSANSSVPVIVDPSTNGVHLAVPLGYEPPIPDGLRLVGRRLEMDVRPVRPPTTTTVPHLKTDPAAVIVAAGQITYTPIAAQLFPGVGVTGSRVWAAWGRNTAIDFQTEEGGNFVVVAYSDDYELGVAATWTEAFYIARPDDPLAVVLDPQFHTDPDGKLWVFYAQVGTSSSSRHQLTSWGFAIKNPQVADRRFFLTDTRFMASGSLAEPFDWNGEPHVVVSYWRLDEARTLEAGKIIHRFDWREGALARVTRIPDVGGGLDSYDECSCVQCPDRSLFAIFRVLPAVEGEPGLWTCRLPADADIEDGWEEPEPFTALGLTTPSRPVMRVTPNGRIALVFNNALTRTTMTLALSEDAGETWFETGVIDARDDVSYPSMAFTADSMLVVYDRGRAGLAEIILNIIDEEALAGGDTVSFYTRAFLSKKP